MPSILEYAETEFSLLAEKPFTDVDSLLLSQFSYMNLSAFEDELKDENKIEIRELLKAERFEKLMFHVRDTKSNMRLLYAMASSPRWRNIKIGNFVEKLCDQSEEQFAAITVYLMTTTPAPYSAARTPRSSAGKRILIWHFCPSYPRRPMRQTM